MAGWGWTLIFLGLGSFLIHYLGMEFMLLAWVDNWGPAIGNGIRIGVAVFGAILVAIGKLKASPSETD